MASQAPDPKTFKSWEDAFAYPVPAVRQMERQLRNDISTNRERLRSLVGGSYRDLLGTAETIIEMDTRMRNVETLVADLGRKCNTGLLDRTKVRSKALLDQTRTPQTSAYALASQTAVFRACPEVILRTLRTDGSLLTAAKALVISRILYTKRLKDNKRFATTIQATSGRLASIRSKLRIAIEKRIASIEQSPESLLDAMAAYALATTSSAADILRHFHHIRATAIANALSTGGSKSTDPVKALKIWLQTLRDTQTLFPRQLITALNQLKSKPLLAGDDLKGISGFDLDVHLHWLGEDIVGYTPYIRHDDLDITTAKKQLSSWAPLTLQAFLKDLRSSLDWTDDLSEVARLRQECFTAWFSGSSRIAGVPRADVLEGLRSAFAERLIALTKERCASLAKLSSQVDNSLKSPDGAEIDAYAPALWDPKMIAMDVSNGGKRFTNTLQASLLGRSRAGDKTIRIYKTWLHGIESIEKTIEEQRKVKWQDLNDDYEEDSDEDELRDTSLSKEDPDNLHKELKTAVNKALEQFLDGLQKSAQSIDSSDNAQAKAAFLSRLTREIQLSLPRSYAKPFATEFKQDLSRRIAEPVAKSVFEKHGRRVSKSLQQKELAIRGLWSDATGLPTIPSPWTFGMLRTCQSSMEAAGQDLWTSSTVAALKALFSVQLSKLFEQARNAASNDEKSDDKVANGVANGDAKVDPRDKYVQQLFDAYYLEAAFLTKQHTKGDVGPFGEHVDWLAKYTQLDKDEQDKVKKGADEQWKRTSLLFALLA